MVGDRDDALRATILTLGRITVLEAEFDRDDDARADRLESFSHDFLVHEGPFADGRDPALLMPMTDPRLPSKGMRSAKMRLAVEFGTSLYLWFMNAPRKPRKPQRLQSGCRSAEFHLRGGGVEPEADGMIGNRELLIFAADLFRQSGPPQIS